MTRSAYRTMIALVLCLALALTASACSDDENHARVTSSAPAESSPRPSAVMIADDRAAIALMARGGIAMFVVPPDRLGQMSEVPGTPEGAYMNVDLSFEEGDTAAQERAMARVLQGELVFAFRYPGARDALAAANQLAERIAEEQQRSGDGERAPVTYALLRRANLVAMIATTDPRSGLRESLAAVMKPHAPRG